MAIHELVQSNNVEVLAEFLNGDLSSINERYGDLQNTPLHTAARKGSLDITELLLKSGASLITKNKKNLIPLQTAVNYGRLEVLKHMLQHEPSFLNHIDNTGNSIMMLAATKGHKDTVSYLLSKHADLSIKNKDGNNVYHVSVQRNRLNVLNLLIKKCEHNHLNATNRKGYTPLHLAAMKGYDEIIKVLLVAKASQHIRSFDGKTAFMIAQIKSMNVFRFYQHYKNIELSCYSGMASLLNTKLFEEGNTAFHIAASFPNSRAIINSLAHGGCMLRVYNNENRMPIHVAAQSGQCENIETILRCGGKVNDVVKDNGNTALHIACKLNNKEIVKILLKHRADIRIKNNDGLTPLTFAIKHHALTVVDLLLTQQENLDLKDTFNNSLLHYCVIENSSLISESLLKKNDSLLKTINDNGLTPLMVATQRKHSTLISLFLSYGANAHWKNANGVSAHSIALEEGDKDVIELLGSQTLIKRKVHFA